MGVQKTYFLSCGTLFFVAAAAHLARLIFGWEIEIAGWAAENEGASTTPFAVFENK